MKKVFWALLLALPMFVFCTENEPEKDDKGPKADPEITLTSDKEVNVDFKGGNVTLTFTCNTDWRVATNELWLKFNPESGPASEAPISVSITCEPNENLESRRATVYVFAGEKNISLSIQQTGDRMAGAGPELKSGSSVLATNPNVEKFLTSVTYPDRNWSYTEVLNYYGGFNGKTYNENGEEDPNGVAFSW